RLGCHRLDWRVLHRRYRVGRLAGAAGTLRLLDRCLRLDVRCGLVGCTGSCRYRLRARRVGIARAGNRCIAIGLDALAGLVTRTAVAAAATATTTATLARLLVLVAGGMNRTRCLCGHTFVFVGGAIDGLR